MFTPNDTLSLAPKCVNKEQGVGALKEQSIQFGSDINFPHVS